MKFFKRLFGESPQVSKNAPSKSAISDFAERTLKILHEKYDNFVYHTILLPDDVALQNFFTDISFMDAETKSTPGNIQLALSANEDGTDIVLILGGVLTSDENYEVWKTCKALGLQLKSMAISEESSVAVVELEKTQQFIRLIEELIKIGNSSKQTEGGLSFFWTKNDKKNPRVIEIGKIIYKLGGNRIAMMQEAARLTVLNLNGGEMDLAAHWHLIGEKEWKNGTGECWMA